MPSNAAPIVQQVQQDFQALVAYLTGPEAQTQTAYTVELTLFRRLLALGAALLRLFFVAQAADRPAAPTAADGTLLAYHDQRPISYYSVFGKLWLRRHGEKYSIPLRYSGRGVTDGSGTAPHGVSNGCRTSRK